MKGCLAILRQCWSMLKQQSCPCNPLTYAWSRHKFGWVAAIDPGKLNQEWCEKQKPKVAHHVAWLQSIVTLQEDPHTVSSVIPAYDKDPARAIKYPPLTRFNVSKEFFEASTIPKSADKALTWPQTSVGRYGSDLRRIKQLQADWALENWRQDHNVCNARLLLS